MSLTPELIQWLQTEETAHLVFHSTSGKLPQPLPISPAINAFPPPLRVSDAFSNIILMIHV